MLFRSRVRPVSSTSPWYVGLSAGAGIVFAVPSEFSGVRWGELSTGSRTPFTFSVSNAYSGEAILETGFVFGADEQYDLGLRITGGMIHSDDDGYADGNFVFGWAFR